jgi:hypothetical protein
MSLKSFGKAFSIGAKIFIIFSASRMLIQMGFDFILALGRLIMIMQWS